ncbi:hypothetical protein [Cellulophaga sp. Hel_I_12]|uniref:hypothetical protein n=1 Tax=Cellulophaga sp. Hel_I_12 TaxID=1249972 RepID=UPI000648A714|nr:hypothetical protein [Cellulophaga sp. Hel_I_12]
MSSRNLTTLPVYRKAMDLCFISREIVSYVTNNKDLLYLYKSNSFRDSIADAILTDAILIPQKIALAERSSCDAIRNTTLLHINIMTKNILSYCRGLEKDGVKEREYISLLRDELKKFRKSYNIWKRSL